jgi:hypothetical protein
MWFAAAVLVAAAVADVTLDATELTIEEPADTAELTTEEALEAMELSAEAMLELTLPLAVDRAEERDAAEEFKALRAEPATELMLEKPDCSAETAELKTEATLDLTTEGEEVAEVGD